MDDFSYRTAGDGQPIVALHASASYPGQWQALMNSAQHTHIVHALDLPGYGTQPVAADGPVGLSRRTAPLIRALESYATPVHLVGHSFGGAIATKIALDRPDLVASLTVWEPTLFQVLADARRADLGTAEQEIRAVRAHVTASCALGEPVAAAKHFVDYWNGPGSFDALGHKQRAILPEAAMRVVADFEDIFADGMRLSDLMWLSVPVHLMSGANSPAAAQAVVALMARAVPNVTRSHIQHAGHMAPVCDAAKVAGMILNHLRDEERTFRPAIAA